MIFLIIILLVRIHCTSWQINAKVKHRDEQKLWNSNIPQPLKYGNVATKYTLAKAMAFRCMKYKVTYMEKQVVVSRHFALIVRIYTISPNVWYTQPLRVMDWRIMLSDHKNDRPVSIQLNLTITFWVSLTEIETLTTHYLGNDSYVSIHLYQQPALDQDIEPSLKLKLTVQFS